jgi:D-alanyl-D-alanine carboxypeptidase
MTAYVTIKLMERFNIGIDTLIEVSQDAAHVHGTSAELVAGDNLTI